MLISLLPNKLHAFFNLFAELVLIAAAIAVTAFAFPVLTQLAAFDERSEAANFPLVIPQSMIAIGYSLMAILVVIRLLTVRRTSISPPPGDAHG